MSHLVLYGSYTRGRYRRGADEDEEARLMIELMRVGWGGVVPAFRQVFTLDLHPERRRAAKAVV